MSELLPTDDVCLVDASAKRRQRHRWTGAQIAEVCKLARQGRTDHEIGRLFGKPYWAVRDARVAAGVTKKGPRPIRVEGSSAFIPLGRGVFAVIDSADAPLVEGSRWFILRSEIGPDCYVVRNLTKGQAGERSLHRLLLPGCSRVDHHDGDPLNNRRANLRPCTQQQNCWNKKVTSRSKVGLKGVSRLPNGKFTATIWIAGRNLHLGTFETAEAAHAAYVAAAIVHFGEFARAA